MVAAFAVVALILAVIAQVRAHGADLVAWAVIALAIIPALGLLRGL